MPPLRRAVQQIRQDLAPADGNHADLFDFQAASDVRQPREADGVDPGRHADANHGENHVAGAGDVVDLAGPRRQVDRLGVPAGEDDAVPIKRDERHVEIELLDEQVAGDESFGDRADTAARRLAGF